jgi:hypothetical protein
MKKIYQKPLAIIDVDMELETILAGSPLGNKVYEEEADPDKPVLSRQSNSIWDDGDAEENW